ncbi:MAG TPA: hypothetical protein VN766_15290 [Stellaceae bacterium]|nr:hypothetical protein [Stellaceae bacterium]
MSEDKQRSHQHVWRFFRAGGFDQVRIDAGTDVAHLAALDQKLWVALACPTRGIQFDERTLDLIDTDRDGRIRAPEMLAAVEWTTAALKDWNELQRRDDSLPLNAIDESSETGKAIRASAEMILAKLGKPDAFEISLQDTLDVEKIYDGTPFNGDGIITVRSASDPAIQSAIHDIMDCLGTEQDRSHEPGIAQPSIDRFFSEAALYAAWHAEGDSARKALLPLGDGIDAAGTLMAAVEAKIDDFFARTRLAAFDPRAAEALNPPLASYEALTAETLRTDGAEIAALPLARIDAGAKLSFCAGLNPAWGPLIARFQAEIAEPLLGAGEALDGADWEKLKALFSAYEAWTARKPETVVEKLGIERLTTLLDPKVKPAIDALVLRDKALEPQMNAIAQVEKLVRMKRDLLPLLNNFVAFKDFYTRTGKAVFQAGTLYLDARSCDLCIKVEDETKHAQLATLSRIYLAYCRCTRNEGKEVMTIAAAFTAGDADNLLVGRNGVFYDRKGRDWDATIVKIVEHPISLRQAFWLPYKQLARFINDQVQKAAAARAASTQAQMASQTMARAAAAASGAPPPPSPQPQNFDAARFAGIFAAIGLAIGAIGTAIASIVTGFLQLSWWQMPLAVVGIILVISGPSCLIAALKLQSRNLGPILDASGWAVNTRLKINLPFGRALTGMAQLPPHAERSLSDPYAEKRQPWAWYGVLLLIVLALLGLWRWGFIAKWLGLP